MNAHNNEESVAPPRRTRIWDIPPRRDFALALHGGAGGQIRELSQEKRSAFEAGLSRAHDAGRSVLAAGGSALDAVCAAVVELEDDPLFNAGRGAALTAEGSVELDAAVMDGAGVAGAVAASRHAKNPVLLARSVMERGRHLFLVSPSEDLVAEWGHQSVPQDYFITEARRRQLARVRNARAAALRHGTVGHGTVGHGTVGAVARDAGGGVAAATSTGGTAGQSLGRVGDSPIIGAGTYARGDLVAISCTGEGEAFIRGVVAHDIAARMRYLDLPLPDAVTTTIAEALTAQNASGGLVTVDAGGRVVVAHNSPTMFAAFEDHDGLVTLT